MRAMRTLRLAAIAGPIAAMLVIAGGTAEGAPAPASGSSGFIAVACETTTSCWAAGISRSGDHAELTEIRGGVPGPAHQILQLYKPEGISCPAPNLCYVVGTSNGGRVGYLVTISNDVVGSPEVVPHTGGLFAIACPTAASCLAAGIGPKGVSANAGGTVVSLNHGVPGTMHTVPNIAGFFGIACLGTSRCVAVGASCTNCFVSQNHGLVVPLVNGTPGTITELAAGTALASVACPTSSSCVALGSNASGPIVVSWANGAATPPKDVPVLADAVGGIACGSPRLCLGVGEDNNTGQGLAIPITAGTPGPPESIPGTIILEGVTCLSRHACLVVGAEGLQKSRGVIETLAS